MTSVLAAVPARDEEDRIGACLASVATALRHARDTGAAQRVAIAVGVHRSEDGTLAAVRRRLEGMPDLETHHHTDEGADTVGEVRHGVVLAAVRGLRLPVAADSWVFSTDADSVVPPTWVSAMLAHAERRQAACVAGLVELDGWRAHPAAAAAYARLVQAGLSDDGHDHVHGANLAVRLDAYAAAGGFPALPHGEDHGLVVRLRRLGERVVSVRSPMVTTSGRTPGRARDGLGGLLQRLAADLDPV